MEKSVAKTCRKAIDSVIPVEHVTEHTRNFLSCCEWKLQLAGELIEIPADVEIGVRSRLFVAAEAEDVFLGDHFEAVVLIGAKRLGRNLVAEHAVLVMYFNLEGQFVSEDRYDRHH